MYIELFLSYSARDRDLAKQFAKHFAKQGILVWWDEKIGPYAKGLDYEISQRLSEAKCVLVLWTNDSVRSDWVISEAQEALKSDKLIQVCINGQLPITPPRPFNSRSRVAVSTDANGIVPTSDLDRLAREIRDAIGVVGPNEHIVSQTRALNEPGVADDTIIAGLLNSITSGLVPGTHIWLSFNPCAQKGVFLIMQLETSPGWVEADVESARERHGAFGEEDEYQEDGRTFLKVSNDIYLIKDPLRPFSIQIGGLRSRRPDAKPGIISGEITEHELSFFSLDFEWLGMTLAEIVSKTETLGALAAKIKAHPTLSDSAKRRIRYLIGRNPYAPKAIQEETCLFCSKSFKRRRCLTSTKDRNKHGAFIIANDFPFGPFFHYIAITESPVHFWEDATFKVLKGLNLVVHEHMQKPCNKHGAAGEMFGFNSTVRHLILGRRTSSSAGASIPHVHKQIWGLAPGSSNLAEQLVTVSQAYWNYSIDYQLSYLETLRESGYVIWEGKHVVLYVPYGQCAKYELQAMVIEPSSCFSKLRREQVIELSMAEYIVLRIYKELGINSFNQVMLSKLYDDNRAPQFRVVECFITREVDLAVSELSMLYVVDQHPWNSCIEVKQIWEPIRRSVVREFRES